MKASKIFALILACCMVFALCACGSTTASSSASEPAAEEPAAVEETADITGNYHFDYTDIYGDVSSFTVTLKDGSFNITVLGANTGVYTGSEWTDNGDGTFTTAATEPALEYDFAGEDGSVTWTIDGSNVIPAGYIAPTEFVEKAAVSDPASAAECVGVYMFGAYNAERGSTTPFILWINADGTYRMFRDNAYLGLRGFSGEWSYVDGNVVALSAAIFDEEDKDPVDDFFNDDWSSSWSLYGDGTAIPDGYEGTPGVVDISTISDMSILPDGYDYVGVYSFGAYNAERGSTTPFILWINADGTYRMFRDNAFLGLRGFSGEWTYNGDGVFAFSAAVFDEEDKDPVDDFFADDWSSVWTCSKDGTCVPEGYEGTAAAVDMSTISDMSIILG